MALLAYEKTLWVNDTAPAINATNLIKIENGIFDVTEAVMSLEANPYTLQGATEANLGGVKVRVTPNGDGTFSGEIWT